MKFNFLKYCFKYNFLMYFLFLLFLLPVHYIYLTNLVTSNIADSDFLNFHRLLICNTSQSGGVMGGMSERLFHQRQSKYRQLERC